MPFADDKGTPHKEKDILCSCPISTSTTVGSATKLGYQSHFFGRTGGFEDDHLPFVQRGVPSADLLDLNYGYNNVFHHTPQTIRAALAFLASGAYPWRALLTHEISLEQLPTFFAAPPDGYLKAIVRP